MHPPCTKKVLLVRMSTFAKSRFLLLIVFRIICFTKLRFLQLQKRFIQKVQKFLDILEASPQSRTADARSCGSRQNSVRFTLRFSGVQILFQVLGHGELEPQIRFFVKFVSSLI